MKSEHSARPRTAPHRCRSLRRLRAYTAVEVLMAMAVLAVGVVGIASMEKITVASSLHAKNLATATHIGQAWIGLLEGEATVWGSDGLLTRTTWLAQGAGQPDWFRPTYDATQLFGPAFDALGNPVTDANQTNNAKYCVDLRFSPLNTTTAGAGLIRVEARVIWLRDQEILASSMLPSAQPCDVAAVSVSTTNNSRLFHFVYLSGAVRQVVSG
jgi:hypothetical protein